MKVSYDPKTDTLSFILKENVSVAESDENKPGIILDTTAKATWSRGDPRCLTARDGGEKDGVPDRRLSP